jgi:hypothetical protein
MTRYQHTQMGTLILALTVLTVAVLVIVGVGDALLPVAAWAVPAAILLATALLFGSLTVTIEDGSLRCHFGPGLIRRTIPLRDIAGCEPVRNKWYYGWGIRLTPRGWMYNVAGLDAVELTLADGRHFRIGTDEPEALCRVLREALAGR